MITLPEHVTCGYCDCSEFGSLLVSPKRIVTRYEIEFYLADGLSTFCDDREYNIKKNYIQIAKPGQVRHSQLPFSTAYVKFDIEGTIANMLRSAPEYFYSNHQKQIQSKIDEMILLNENPTEHALLLQSLMLSFFHLILSDSKIANRKIGTDYEVISNAKRFIETHASEKIKLQDIAASVNLSDIYFHNNFTIATGLTPHQYLTECRIAQAKKLLWSSKMAMSDISDQCGFSSQQHLTKVFKKETGMTPAQYRKSFQKKYLY